MRLADIFAHEDWQEGRYLTAKTPSGEQAMALPITKCDETGSLEIRLAGVTGKASIDVAQALDSVSSKVTLEFTLLADQRRVETKLVKFNQQATLSTSLDGVSALELQVKPAPGVTSCPVTAVVTRYVIEP